MGCLVRVVTSSHWKDGARRHVLDIYLFWDCFSLPSFVIIQYVYYWLLPVFSSFCYLLIRAWHDS